MIIYQNTTDEFYSECINNTIADSVKERYLALLGRQPGYSEEISWRNSLPKVCDLIKLAKLEDNIIAIEYEIPYNQNRIDVLLFGKDDNDESNAVLIELKQWSSVEPISGERNFVETYTGGNKREVAHPSQQIKGYSNYLKGFISEFELPPQFNLYSCSYCHNYKRIEGEGLFDSSYLKLIKEYPLFSSQDTKKLAEVLKTKLSNGDGWEVFNRFMLSPIRHSKKLLDSAAKVIRNEEVYALIDDQIVAKNKIWANVQRAKKNNEKSVIIVHGGPGTGKSLIALNVLAESASRGNKVFFACKSKSFIEGIKNRIGKDKGYDPRLLFKNLTTFLPSKIKKDELDLLLVDEAHRIENSGLSRYSQTIPGDEIPQIEHLIRCAKTSVFFIDEHQNVRSQETCSPDKIKDAANKWGRKIYEVNLTSQFRCMGSNDYILWLESILGYNGENKILKKQDIFDFKIFSSPQKLYEEIKNKNNEKENSARLTAGFCWPWSKNLNSNGELNKDIKIGNFEMPWETHLEITKPPVGYVKWYEWAYKPDGIKQVGCIYTAQGFEFDYVGVIIGDDLVYDKKENSLITNIKKTEDPMLKKKPDEFDKYVRNIYRVLMTRGMKGCYVYFVNKETEAYFKRFIEV